MIGGSPKVENRGSRLSVRKQTLVQQSGCGGGGGRGCAFKGRTNPPLCTIKGTVKIPKGRCCFSGEGAPDKTRVSRVESCFLLPACFLFALTLSQHLGWPFSCIQTGMLVLRNEMSFSYLLNRKENQRDKCCNFEGII